MTRNLPLLRCLQCLMDKLASLQELVVRATGLTETIIGDGVRQQMMDGIMGLVQAGPRLGSIRVLDMGHHLLKRKRKKDVIYSN